MFKAKGVNLRVWPSSAHLIVFEEDALSASALAVVLLLLNLYIARHLLTPRGILQYEDKITLLANDGAMLYVIY